MVNPIIKCVLSGFMSSTCSMGIESVVDENAGKSSGLHDAMCSACEMAVVWMQNQLRQNQTQERILNYVNEVNSMSHMLSLLILS